MICYLLRKTDIFEAKVDAVNMKRKKAKAIAISRAAAQEAQIKLLGALSLGLLLSLLLGAGRLIGP